MRKSQYSMDQPATYRIRVHGTLDRRWSNRMGDMQITHSISTLNQTVLIGELADQAELFGVLNSLYTLGLVLLLVEYIKGQNKGILEK